MRYLRPPADPENLGELYKENGKVKLVCNRIECLVEAAERVRRNRDCVPSIMFF